jgi:hypothetical protein
LLGHQCDRLLVECPEFDLRQGRERNISLARHFQTGSGFYTVPCALENCGSFFGEQMQREREAMYIHIPLIDDESFVVKGAAGDATGAPQA